MRANVFYQRLDAAWGSDQGQFERVFVGRGDTARDGEMGMTAVTLAVQERAVRHFPHQVQGEK